MTSYLSKLAYRIVAGIGFILLIASFLLPWIAFRIPLSGEEGYTLLKFIESVSEMQLAYNLGGEGFGVLYLALIFLIVSLVMAFASLFWIPASIISGGSGLMSAGLWIVEMEALKVSVEAHMPKIGKALSNFIGIGSGVILAIAGSIIMIIDFVAGFDFGESEKLGK